MNPLSPQMTYTAVRSPLKFNGNVPVSETPALALPHLLDPELFRKITELQTLANEVQRQKTQNVGLQCIQFKPSPNFPVKEMQGADGAVQGSVHYDTQDVWGNRRAPLSITIRLEHPDTEKRVEIGIPRCSLVLTPDGQVKNAAVTTKICEFEPGSFDMSDFEKHYRTETIAAGAILPLFEPLIDEALKLVKQDLAAKSKGKHQCSILYYWPDHGH